MDVEPLNPKNKKLPPYPKAYIQISSRVSSLIYMWKYRKFILILFDSSESLIFLKNFLILYFSLEIIFIIVSFFSGKW